MPIASQLSHFQAFSVNFNTTNYFPIVGDGNSSTTEADRKIKYRTAGTLAKFSILVTVNSIATTATTIRTRKNAGNGNQSVSVGAGSTGLFQDTTNTDTIAVGDDVNCQVVTPNTSGAMTLQGGGSTFLDPAATTQRIANRQGSVNSNNTTVYGVLSGVDMFPSEANAQLKMRTAGTFKNMFSEIVSNLRTTTTTFRLRKNTANGNQILTIGAAATGQFEDTTNTDAVVSGDLVNYSHTYGASAESLTLGTWMAVEFTTTNLTSFFQAGINTGVGISLTRYFPISAGSAAQSSESSAALYASATFKASNLILLVASNTNTATSTLTLRKNSAAANQTISIGASATGYFEDTTNVDTFVPTDTINTRLVTGGTGTTLTFNHTSLLATFVGMGAFLPFM